MTSTFLDSLRAEAVKRAEAGLTRSVRPRGAERTALDLAGNDYLGLATDERVTDAAAAAVGRWGASAAASRLVTGSLDLHAELETALAAFCRQPAALVFSSGYMANLGIVTALASPDMLIVSDAHIHASLVDACRLCRARVQIVPHGDTVAVESALASRQETHAIVLAESVYSVLGDAPPLTVLARVTRRYGAVLVVDEAHALGVGGPQGRGLVEASGLAGRPDIVVTASLSKALGSQGGVVLGAAEVIGHLVNVARPFIFDTGLNPASTAAALAALQIVVGEPERVAAVRACAAVLAPAARVAIPPGAVLSVPTGSPEQAVTAAAAFLDRGIRVGCFRPPSVPGGLSRLRLTAHATLTGADLDHVRAVTADVVAELAKS